MTNSTSASYPPAATSKRYTRRSGSGAKWIEPNKTFRRFACFDRTAGQGVTDDGQFVRLRKSSGMSEMLRAFDDRGTDRLYLIGSWPRDFAKWRYQPLPEGWRNASDYFGATDRSWILRFDRPDGRRFEVLHAGEWFGDDDISPRTAAQALLLVDEELAREFRGFRIKNRPSTTGRHLWRSTIGYGVEWPCAHPEDQELLRTTGPQARIEFLGDGSPVSQFFELDSRFAYAACTRELGGGEITRTDEPFSQVDFQNGGALRHGRGWHHVVFEANTNKTPIGLLPVKCDEKWTWPTNGRHKTWAGANELTLAAQYGWRFEVFDSLMFNRIRGQSGPLDSWTGRRDRPTGLIRAQQRARDNENYPADVRSLASSAIRTILRNTIGTFHSGSAKAQHTTPINDADRDIPNHAQDITNIGDFVVWTEMVDSRSPGDQHPEFSVQVWERCRRLITQEAMLMPREWLLGIATDAVYLTDDPGIVDRGRVGDLRVKSRHTFNGFEVRPTSLNDLWSIRNG